MKYAMVSSAKLGLKCWLPYRFVGHVGSCFLCDKYATCKYPERVQSVQYDNLLRKLEEAKSLVKVCVNAVEEFGRREIK